MFRFSRSSDSIDLKDPDSSISKFLSLETIDVYKRKVTNRLMTNHICTLIRRVTVPLFVEVSNFCLFVIVVVFGHGL